MTYTKTDESRIIIDDTEVDDTLKGQGVGTQLAKAAIDYARSNELKIIPNCSFLNQYFQNHND